MNDKIFDIDFLIQCFNVFKNRWPELTSRLYTKLHGKMHDSKIAFLVAYLTSTSKQQIVYRAKAIELLRMVEL